MYSNNLERISNQTINAGELAFFSMFIQKLPRFKNANNIIQTLSKCFSLEALRQILFKNNLKDLDVIVNSVDGNRRYTLINYFVAKPVSREMMIQGRSVIHTRQEFAKDFCELFSKPETAALVSENFKKAFQRLCKEDSENFAVRWHEVGTDTMLPTLPEKKKDPKRKKSQLTITPLEKIDVNITHNEVIIYLFLKMLYRVNYKNNYLGVLTNVFNLEKVIKALLDTKLRYFSEVLFHMMPQDNRYVFFSYFLCTLERRQIFLTGSHLKQDINTDFQLLFANEEEKNAKSLENAFQQLHPQKQTSLQKRFKEKTAHIEKLQTLVDKLPLPATTPQTNLLEALPKIFCTRPDIEEFLLRDLDLISVLKVSKSELLSPEQNWMSHEITVLKQTVTIDEPKKSRPLKRQKIEPDKKTLVLSNETSVNEQAEESIWKDLLLDQLESLEYYDSPTYWVNHGKGSTVESPGSGLGLFGLFSNQGEKTEDQGSKNFVLDTPFL